jgi:hypothetical protein
MVWVVLFFLTFRIHISCGRGVGFLCMTTRDKKVRQTAPCRESVSHTSCHALGCQRVQTSNVVEDPQVVGILRMVTRPRLPPMWLHHHHHPLLDVQKQAAQLLLCPTRLWTYLRNKHM